MSKKALQFYIAFLVYHSKALLSKVIQGYTVKGIFSPKLHNYVICSVLALTFPKHSYLHYSRRTTCKSIVINLRCCCPIETMATYRLRSKHSKTAKTQHFSVFSTTNNDKCTPPRKTHTKGSRFGPAPKSADFTIVVIAIVRITQ